MRVVKDCLCAPKGRRHWQADYWCGHDGAKQRRHLTSDRPLTRVEAERWYESLRVAARERRPEALPERTERFARVVERFLRDYRSEVAPPTFANAESIARLYLLPRFGHLPVRAVDVATVKDFRHELSRGLPRSVVTARVDSVRRELERTGWAARNAEQLAARLAAERDRILSRPLSTRQLKAIFNYLGMVMAAAVEEGLAASNPVNELRRKALRGADARKPMPLTEPELLRLEELLRDEPARLRLPVLLMAFCGLRRGEALGVQPRDFMREERLLRIDRIITKGRVTTPKMGKCRVVPVPPWLAAELDAAIRSRKVATLDGTDWLFGTEGGRPQFNNVERQWDRVRRALAAATGRAELVGLHLHDLRHTYLTTLGNAEATPWAMQAIAGHASPKMTAHYTRASIAAMHAATALLPVPNRCATEAPTAVQ